MATIALVENPHVISLANWAWGGGGWFVSRFLLDLRQRHGGRRRSGALLSRIASPPTAVVSVPTPRQGRGRVHRADIVREQGSRDKQHRQIE